MLIFAEGYGEGGAFRELQDPPWLLLVVPWYCNEKEEKEDNTQKFMYKYKF